MDTVEVERRLRRERARVEPKLARGRERAASRMAAEHARVERFRHAAAEDAAFAEAVPRAGVAGPDGRTVTIDLAGTGMFGGGFALLGGGGGMVTLVVAGAVAGCAVLVHKVVYRGGWTVHVWSDAGHLKLRCASREEARSRAVAVADLVRRSGTAGLRAEFGRR